MARRIDRVAVGIGAEQRPLREAADTAGKLSWQSELRSESFPKQMARDTDGAPVAWKALDDSVPSLDWWPDDVPVVLAQLDGGEGKTSDSGLKLESDRVLIRVLGWGGAP